MDLLTRINFFASCSLDIFKLSLYSKSRFSIPEFSGYHCMIYFPVKSEEKERNTEASKIVEVRVAPPPGHLVRGVHASRSRFSSSTSSDSRNNNNSDTSVSEQSWSWDGLRTSPDPFETKNNETSGQDEVFKLDSRPRTSRRTEDKPGADSKQDYNHDEAVTKSSEFTTLSYSSLSQEETEGRTKRRLLRIERIPGRLRGIKGTQRQPRITESEKRIYPKTENSLDQLSKDQISRGGFDSEFFHDFPKFSGFDHGSPVPNHVPYYEEAPAKVPIYHEKAPVDPSVLYVSDPWKDIEGVDSDKYLPKPYAPLTTSSPYSYQEPSYHAQEPSYHAPEPSYHAPEPSYHAPVPSYHAPEPSYHAPEPSYHAPEPSYHAPEPSYYAPEQSYHAPEHGYHAPEPSYHAPEPSYHAPKPAYDSPKDHYTQKPNFQYKKPAYRPPIGAKPVHNKPTYDKPLYNEPKPYNKPLYTKPAYTKKVNNKPVYTPEPVHPDLYNQDFFSKFSPFDSQKETFHSEVFYTHHEDDTYHPKPHHEDNSYHHVSHHEPLQKPHQVYHEPQQVNHEPHQVNHEPHQVNHEPHQVYHETNNVYYDPQKNYHEPHQIHYEPHKEHYEPHKDHYEPHKVHQTFKVPHEQHQFHHSYHHDDKSYKTELHKDVSSLIYHDNDPYSKVSKNPELYPSNPIFHENSAGFQDFEFPADFGLSSSPQPVFAEAGHRNRDGDARYRKQKQRWRYQV